MADFSLWIVFAALVIDGLIGDPDWLWRRLPHPVVWFGQLIDFGEKRLNRPTQQTSTQGKAAGALLLVLLLAISFGVGLLLQSLLLPLGLLGQLAVALVASVFLAQKSLYEHVRRVCQPLSRGDLSGARKAVAMIVGRDPDTLDEAGVARAAIESTAENYSDGIVAPLFWFLVLGLPGLFAYKALNTADSMIGHKTDRYLHFGWASARLDDVANWIPARLTMLVLVLVPTSGLSGSRTEAFSMVRKDAGKHRSPNAGWPEAAMAGRLGIALSGPRIYGDKVNDEPYVNEAGRKDIGALEIDAALGLYRNSCMLMAVGVGLLAFVLG